MNSGRIEQVGRPTDIYENPGSNFIARFLGEANLIEGTIEEASEGVAVLRIAGGLRLRARIAEGATPGARANLFVRPERVTLAREGGGIAADQAINHATGPTRSLSVYVTAACLVLMLPIVIVIILAFGHQGYLKFPPDSYSLRWFATFFGGRVARLPRTPIINH